MPRSRSNAKATPRYVLRFCGEGTAPRADVALLEAESKVTVVEFAPPRLMLVQATERRLRIVLRRLPGWVMSAERTVRLPARPTRKPRTSP
jgi:hypothetical protein